MVNRDETFGANIVRVCELSWRGAAARRAGAVCLFGFLFVFVLYGCVVAGKKCVRALRHSQKRIETTRVPCSRAKAHGVKDVCTCRPRRSVHSLKWDLMIQCEA